MTSSEWLSFPDLNTGAPEVMFRLPASHGRVVSPADYRQRQGLCLLFLPDGDAARWQDALASLAAARAELEERDAAALAMLPVDQSAATLLAGQLRMSPVLLADENGQVRGRYLSLAPHLPASAAFVFLLDRWGAPLAAGPAEDDWIGEALAWFDLALARCPE